MPTDIAPTTVSEGGISESVEFCFQRKAFYANGRHWVFYLENITDDGGPTWVYRSSADGVTWTDYTVIRLGDIGSELSVAVQEWTDPQQYFLYYYVHYVWADQDNPSDLVYRRGLLGADGVITWETAEQTAYAEQDDTLYLYPTIAIDGDHLPWIGFTQFNTVTQKGLPLAHHSTTVPTWTTEGLFPWPLVPDELRWDDSWIVLVTAWDGNIFCVYTKENFDILCDYYDIGSFTWHGEFASGHFMGPESENISITSIAEERFEEPVNNPVVHVAWQDWSGNLAHFSYDIVNGISAKHMILTSDTQAQLAPAMTVMRYGEGGAGGNPHRTLYVFWTPKSVDPIPDYVCYKKSENDGVTWTKEDGSAGTETWIDETLFDISQVNGLSVCPWSYSNWTGKSYISLTYTRESASPDHVRYAGLEFSDPSINLASGFTIRRSATSNMPAGFHIVSRRSLPGAFVVRHRADIELLGEFIARQSDAENLSAGFRGQAILNLPAGFESQAIRPLSAELMVRHSDAGNLKAGFVIRQGFKILPAWLKARHGASGALKGGFDGQVSLNLPGAFVVLQGAQDLLAGLLLQQAAARNLLCGFVVRHDGLRNLLGHLVARHTGMPLNLPGAFVVRHAATLNLPGGFIIRHSDAENLKAGFLVFQFGIMQGVQLAVYRDIGVVS